MNSRPQPNSPVSILLAISVFMTALLCMLYGIVICQAGLTVLEIVSFPAFAVLAYWVCLGFANAVLGFDSIKSHYRLNNSMQQEAISTNSLVIRKTAIIVPVYNEEPSAVLARVKAMIDSLSAEGQQRHFDFFILSDTTDPEIWLAEERLWFELIRRYQLPANVYYRRRLKNTHRKSGNLADFCERWGAHYNYMIVMDADSLMSGSTMIEMVLRMEKDAKLGILQVPPRPINRNSLFARLQQFSAWFYGPLCTHGFSRWAGSSGNYWGHNAIIRTQAFLHHCRLPILPGVKPLGGEILSHDFVEAAMMLRAGYKVELACDLEGSFEECPTTLADYAIRDQRWSQGNLQHFQLLFCEGMNRFSRAHFAMGIMSYVSSPIWLLFIGLTILNMALFPQQTAAQESPLPLVLFGLMMTLLLMPKFFSLWYAIRFHNNRPKQLNAVGMAMSVFLEIVCSVLMAPIMGYYHSKFVLTTLMGKTVKWNCQQRSEQCLSFKEALMLHYEVFVFYAFVTAFVAAFTPSLLLWMTPLIVGPLLIVPFAVLLSSRKVGVMFRQLELLLIPEEIVRPQLITTSEEVEAELQDVYERTGDHFEAILIDPKFMSLHKHILRYNMPEFTASQEQISKTLSLVSQKQYGQISKDDRRCILADINALRELQQVALSAD